MPNSTAFQVVAENGLEAAALLSPTHFSPHNFHVILFLIKMISEFICVSGIQELDSFMHRCLSFLFQVLVPI